MTFSVNLLTEEQSQEYTKIEQPCKPTILYDTEDIHSLHSCIRRTWSQVFAYIKA